MISYGGDYVEILKGMVKDAGYPDEECNYVKIDDNTIYYFIKDYQLKNGNIIATNILKEAIGHAPYTSLGVIDQNDGKLLIPFENKTIKQIGDNLLLVEKNVPTTQSVVEALKNKSDPFTAQTLAENASKIKQQLKDIMGMNGDFIFDNQFSEAAIYTMDGVNVAGNYFSFIGENNGDYYLATNVLGATIMKFNPEQLQQPETNTNTVEQTNDTSDIQGGTQDESTIEQPPEVNSNAENEEAAPDNLMPNIDIPIQSMAEQEQNTPDAVDTPAPPVQDDSTTIPEDTQNESVSEQPPEVSGEDDSNEEMKLNIPMDSSEDTNEKASDTETSQDEDIEKDSSEDSEVSDDASSEENESSSDSEIEDSDENVTEDEKNTNTDIDEEDEGETKSEEESEENTLDDDTSEEDVEISSDDSDDDLENTEDSEDTYSEEEEDSSENEMAEDTDEKDSNESDENEIEEEKNESSKPYSLTDEDIATPTIKDATNTIRNLLEENRKQRRIIDKQIGEIEALKTNADILREENFSQEQEITSLRDEMNSYRNQSINLTRENAKLTGAIERQNDIMKRLEEQNTGLRNQVAGMHALSDAIVEANALVQPVEDESKYYGNITTNQTTSRSSNLNIDNYLNGNYSENNLGYLGDSHSNSASELESVYQKSKVA